VRPVAEPAAGAPFHLNGNDIPPDDMSLDGMEQGLIRKALGQAKGNKSRAARLLGLSRAQLYWRLEKYDIN
jgi:DNA-binding protein Fis